VLVALLLASPSGIHTDFDATDNAWKIGEHRRAFLLGVMMRF